MKKLFLSLVATMIAMVSFAQNQIATLSHGDEIKTFYGSSAFASAMNAADNGDIITLSSGHFTSTNITKAVTLRGAGMVELTDNIGFHAPTVIGGDFTIQIPEEVENRLSIDGVKFENDVRYSGILKNPIFTKCNFYIIRYNNFDSKIQNAILVNCRVRDGIVIYRNSTIACINSVICNPYSDGPEAVDNTFEFINCVIKQVTNPSYLSYSTFKNCYIDFTNGYMNYAYPSTCVINACCSNNDKAFVYSINPTNKYVMGTDMFVSYPGTRSWSDGDKFILKDEVAAEYLGDDGTQVGLYGGNMPYDERISMPYITKCNVAGKSTADGKLSVDIQIEAAQ